MWILYYEQNMRDIDGVENPTFVITENFEILVQLNAGLELHPLDV